MVTFEQVVKENPNIEWKDITGRKWREYEFAEKTIRIEQTVALNVSASGGHRIVDANNVGHYIPAGWLHISWEAEDGGPYRF
jgi:hypothetical protein